MDTSLVKRREFSWRLWPLVPLYPYGHRRTLRQTIIPGHLWTFDQLQGIFYVVVPIRMTVIKLEQGGLLVYAPVAPTPECICLVRELEAEHGPVKYIIHPTISGLEHKVFVGPFARHFPGAEVYVAPYQWSFPLNLPLRWLGFPLGRTKVLPKDSKSLPFADQFDYALLEKIELGLGRFTEVAFYDKKSHTLLLTDSIVAIPEQPPAILQQEPLPLLFHARDSAGEALTDTPENRRKGWHRICLFAMYFQPSMLEVVEWGKLWQEAKTAPDRSKKAYFGLYPFFWKIGWERSFEQLRGGGRLLVAPVLQKLILNRAPEQTLAWVEKISQWDFHRLIPCHFDAPLLATGADLKAAFEFLKNKISAPLPPADLELMSQIDERLVQLKIVPPAK